MIKNKNKIISNEEIICKTIRQQARGLMFKKKQNLIMFFNKKRKVYLHNFFVFYPLEIILLDHNKKVIEIKKKFKPFQFYNTKKEGNYLIELGLNKSKNKLKLNDIVTLDI